ncbi:MAG: periplasmic heavy metal sensor [Candidatus Omnitrophica bacterium]|nr:periplasmic heavy metal sensor [Candidatus Omnitrophota bacterium]
MQKKIQFILISSVFISIVFWSFDGYAQRSREGRPAQRSEGNRRGSAPDEIYDRLQLTERQKVMLEKNRIQYHDQIRDLNQKLTNLKRQLNIELEKRSLNRDRIDTIKSQIDRLQSQLSDIRLQGIMAIRDILTPAQYEIFLEMME